MQLIVYLSIITQPDLVHGHLKRAVKAADWSIGKVLKL